MELPRLVAALASPEAYPHAVDRVEVRHTHISVVFLAGEYVYKLKKPVQLAFLDFSTVDRRHYFCQEEVRLNRRLAPKVYLDVVPLALDRGMIRVEAAGAPIDWAVKMRRLPQDATLLERLRRGELGSDVLVRLAQRVAAFHQEPASSQPALAADHDAVAQTLRDVLEQAAAASDAPVSRAVLQRLDTLTMASLTDLQDLIAGRARRGMTRDGHGDLHLDHVYYFPGATAPDDLVIVDCIEFSERLRCIDPVADMAFTVMDLAYRGRRDLADVFAAAYFEATGDAAGRRLVPLYSAYRAMVRGLVAGIKRAEPEVPPAERAHALQSARAHWLLALGELEAPAARPCLLLVGGLPGTGKSTLARSLADAAGFTVIRSDVVRKELAGARSTVDLYSDAWNDRTYAECLRQAQVVLTAGGRVLVDASFREEARRHLFLDSAARHAVPGFMLHCCAAPDTVRTRLQQRRGDASDADWAVYERLAPHWEPVGETGRLHVYTIQTDGRVAESLVHALDVLRRVGLN